MTNLNKENLKPALVLTTICIIVALLLASINLITGPIIDAAQNAAANEALLEVLPDGKNFEEIPLDDKYPAAITAAYKADGGFVFRASVTGKSSGLVIMCGVSADGKIVGTKVIADQETDSYDSNVFPLVEGIDGKYKDMDNNNFEPYLVSGATLTSRAYGEAIKAALQAFIVAGGGEVDYRSPEQIACNAALGTDNLEFTKWFATEVLTGVDAVYESEGGRVFLIGEKYIGVKDGAVVTADASDENKATALSADALVSASTLTEITASLESFKDSLGEEKNAKINKAYVTASGNYLFELTANGYSIKYGYGNNKPISIKLSVSADGKIIDVYTVDHAESQGFGDKCQTEEYYEQYRGKGDGDIKVSSNSYAGYQDNFIPDTTTDVGAIASSTNTTIGYQKAIKLAFKAFGLLTEGGNE